MQLFSNKIKLNRLISPIYRFATLFPTLSKKFPFLPKFTDKTLNLIALLKIILQDFQFSTKVTKMNKNLLKFISTIVLRGELSKSFLLGSVTVFTSNLSQLLFISPQMFISSTTNRQKLLTSNSNKKSFLSTTNQNFFKSFSLPPYHCT